MAGLAPLVLQQPGLGSAQPGAGAPKPSRFADRFQADSASAGSSRATSEKRKLAERLCAVEDWEGALDAFHGVAEAAQEQDDPGEEAWAVLGMAECLAKGSEVDDVLVLGMYGHAARRAAAAADSRLRFSALAGGASLQRSLRRPAEAAAAWEEALEFARGADDTSGLAFACTQLAFVLMDDSVELVNADKQIVHKVENATPEVSGEEADIIKVGAEPKLRRAIKLLEEAYEIMSRPGQDPVLAATAAMNLSQGLMKTGGSVSKRKAERVIAGAFESIRQVGTDEQMLNIARQLVALHQDNPFLEKGSEHMATLEECNSMVAAASKSQIQAMVQGPDKATDPEARHAEERAMWAQRKLAEMQARQQDSDSDDDAGPAHPKGAEWRR